MVSKGDRGRLSPVQAPVGPAEWYFMRFALLSSGQYTRKAHMILCTGFLER